MVPWAHSDRAYLVENNARSRAGRHCFLSNFVSNLEKGRTGLNGSMHTLCKILKNVVESKDECGIASRLEDGQVSTVIKRTSV